MRSPPLTVTAAAPVDAIVKRSTRGSAGRVANHVNVVATAATASAPAVSAAMRCHSGRRGSSPSDGVLMAATPV